MLHILVPAQRAGRGGLRSGVCSGRHGAHRVDEGKEEAVGLAGGGAGKERPGGGEEVGAGVEVDLEALLHLLQGVPTHAL